METGGGAGGGLLQRCQKFSIKDAVKKVKNAISH